MAVWATHRMELQALEASLVMVRATASSMGLAAALHSSRATTSTNLVTPRELTVATQTLVSRVNPASYPTSSHPLAKAVVVAVMVDPGLDLKLDGTHLLPAVQHSSTKECDLVDSCSFLP